MEYTLEVVVMPVSDMDRAKEFYADKCGFKVDLDQQVTPTARIIQITPPGSRCSIALIAGMPLAPGQKQMEPGALQGLQLCVTDIESAHAELSSRGVGISEVQHVGAGGWEPGKGETWNSFAFFTDPDGNGWILQEAPAPLSER
ncbi:VOC family protein [Streptomyces sp. TRM66268-LWL]|uniref:VOC family protein n=1 Tax=Streptomyces polyasparticus TaxID=2767826 RepID=A0ABR7SBL2_9ACTN|nr:VOC family protein [Streptomyces polyasparticus]MBC9712409.1 VOC family protein [Streptomyces polyasparticus]